MKMAQEYVLCDKQSDLGVIALNKTVFETIAYISLDEFDCVNKDPKVKKCVSTSVKENKLCISMDVKLKMGSNVTQVSHQIQEKVFQNVFEMTGFKCETIDVVVKSFEY